MTTTKNKRSRSPYVDDDDEEEEEEHCQKRGRQTTLHSTPQQKKYKRKDLEKRKLRNHIVLYVKKMDTR